MSIYFFLTILPSFFYSPLFFSFSNSASVSISSASSSSSSNIFLRFGEFGWLAGLVFGFGGLDIPVMVFLVAFLGNCTMCVELGWDGVCREIFVFSQYIVLQLRACFIGGDWTGGVRDDIRSGT